MNRRSSNETIIHIHSSTTYTIYKPVYKPNADPHTNPLKTATQNKRTFLSTLSAINPIWTDVRSTPGLHGDTPVTNRLSHGTALFTGQKEITLPFPRLPNIIKIRGSGDTNPGKNAPFPSAKSPRRLNYVRWGLTSLDPQCGTYFIAPFLRLEF